MCFIPLTENSLILDCGSWTTVRPVCDPYPCKMVLPSNDRYALCLVAFFAMLDGYAELKRPHKPPPPDLRDGNETLQNLRSAAHEVALERWKIEYLQPWLQRKERHDKQKERHDKQKRDERRKTLRTHAAAGDETARQRQDSERNRNKKSKQS